MFLTWLIEWIGFCGLVQDRHHPTKNTKATKGNMMIVLTLFGFDTSIPQNTLLSKDIIKLFEKYTLPIC